LAVHIRSAPGAPPAIEAARDIVGRLDPNVPVYRIESLEEVIGTATSPTRLYLVVVGLFAATAALLAAVGLYGVMSQIVAQRTREIGIRMALGAKRDTIVGLVVRQGMQPAAIGLVIGIGAAIAFGRYLESVLFGVRPGDPIVFTAATMVMGGVALLAAAIPAFRASAVDPAKVLNNG
jgi:ABC-type antimicrobial peptide transport system permease subunit